MSKLFQALGLERVRQKKCWMDSRYHIDRILSYIAKNRLIPKQDLLDAYLLEDLKNLVDKNKKLTKEIVESRKDRHAFVFE